MADCRETDQRSGVSMSVFESINPANGETVGTVTSTPIDEIPEVVAQARQPNRPGRP